MAAARHQIRSYETGSSIGEPSELREVQAGAVREIGASVWTTELLPVGHRLGDEPVTGMDGRLGGLLAIASFGLRGSSPSPATGRGKAGTFHSGAPS